MTGIKFWQRLRSHYWISAMRMVGHISLLKEAHQLELVCIKWVYRKYMSRSPMNSMYLDYIMVNGYLFKSRLTMPHFW